MASIWDDPEIRSGGEFVSFTEPGDNVRGTIQVIRVHRFDDGKVAPQILLVTDDGQERTVTAGQVGLKAKLAELRPEAGDWIHITMTRIETRAGGRELKHWDVKHRSQGTVTDTPAASAPQASGSSTASEPPGGLTAEQAAALAQLTDEQRVALGLAS